MANLHLVTGYQGTAHITSADQGVLNACSVGTGEYVLAKGRRFEAQIINNNTVRINDGCLMMNGRQVNLDSGSYQDVTIRSGTEGTYRNDIIVARYDKDIVTGLEGASLAVVTGTESASSASDPVITDTNSILDGSISHDMPLYRVVLDDLRITKVEPLFQVLAPMADIQHGFYKQNLLINGDFQCNQRGQKTYAATNTSDVKYSVDMWRIHQLTLQVLNEGVKITGGGQGYLTQFIQLGKLKTITYTISAMVDDKIYTFTVTPGGEAKEKDFGKFKISALTISTWNNDLGDYDNKLKINICPIGANSFVLKYVDVFEGTVAYPHVKEDPATALMRCRRYIQHGRCVSPIIYADSDGSGTDALWQYRFGITFEEMAPFLPVTLEKCNWNYFDRDSSVASYDMTKVDIVNATNYLIECKSKDSTKMSTYTNGIRVEYVVSCEPLPTGDTPSLG